MIGEGGPDEETAIYQLDLSAKPPTQTLYIHSLLERADPGPSF